MDAGDREGRTGSGASARRPDVRPAPPDDIPLAGADDRQRGLAYQLAAEAAGIGTWERDLASDSVSICPVMARMLDLPGHYARPRASEWRDLIHADDLDAVSYTHLTLPTN